MSLSPLQTAPKGVQTIRQQLAGDYFKQQVALSLPKHMTPDRFVRVGLTALMKTPKLLDCTPESVIQCMLNCSALGLEPDGRRAHLIPYGNTCTLIVDYKGIVELAKRSGDVASVFAQIVCEKDSFQWKNGEVEHQIDFKNERGQMYAAYAVITFKDGTKQTDVMTKHEVDSIRKRSKSGNSGPWVTDYNEMAKKTVFRRASKWITLSPEVADALDKEESGAPFSSASLVADIQSAPAPAPASETAAIEVESVAGGEDDDQIPGAEIPPKKSESSSSPAPAATPKPSTLHAELTALYTDAGFTFDQFRKWGFDSGNIPDADSIADISELHEVVVKRLLRSKAGIVQGLQRLFPKAA